MDITSTKRAEGYSIEITTMAFSWLSAEIRDNTPPKKEDRYK